MRPLSAVIRPYAWGSRTALATLRGRPGPSPEPEAELWLGAHPGAPSRFPDGVPLPEAFAADPALLGPAARLPYLLKLLAAASPLSLQAHPDADRARARFAAGHPGYQDPYHKPELLVALENFDGLCGFREPSASADTLASFGVPALASVVQALRAGPVDHRLRGAVELLLRWPAGERARLVEDVVKAAGSGDSEAHALAADLGHRYPGDPGVIVALLLNRVHLRPDEAVFMPAGNLHAYLNGFGVEIMAASDNVLRGGLTPKAVDVDELLAVLRYEVLAEPVVRPVVVAPGLLTWPAPVAEFVLHKATPVEGSVVLPGSGPRIVVATAGAGTVRAGAQELPLAPGDAIFVPATDPPVEVHAPLTLFQAATPHP